MDNFNLAILASGEGSTGEVLFDKARVVITNKPNAGIIIRARKAGVPVAIIERKGKSSEEFGQEILEVLEKYEIDFISHNGWEALTPKEVVQKYQGKIVNAHPAPMDPGHLDFGGKGMYGLAVHQAVLNFAKKISRPFQTEICLHLVTEEFDKGELVAISKVDISNDDSAETLQARVKEEERKLLKDFWTKVFETGKIETIQRTERVIQPGEEEILEESKREVIAEYSQG